MFLGPSKYINNNNITSHLDFYSAYEWFTPVQGRRLNETLARWDSYTNITMPRGIYQNIGICMVYCNNKALNARPGGRLWGLANGHNQIISVTKNGVFDIGRRGDRFSNSVHAFRFFKLRYKPTEPDSRT